jgi:hypothetical protein
MGAATIRRDLSAYQNENVQFTQEVYESDGTTLRDLTGYTPTFYIYDNGDTYVTDTTGVTETSTGILTGDVDISSMDPTPGPGDYICLLEIDNGADPPEVLFEGRLEIIRHPA